MGSPDDLATFRLPANTRDLSTNYTGGTIRPATADGYRPAQADTLSQANCCT